MSLKFKIIKSVPRKFIYTTDSVYTLKNILAISRLEYNATKKYSNELKNKANDFLYFCKKNEISPFNFLDDKDNYILTTEETKSNVINLKERYGLSSRFIIEKKLKDINFDDVYNFDCSNNIIEYSYKTSDTSFIETLESVIDKDQKIDLIDDRETKHRLESYLSLKICDYTNKSSLIYKDFAWFNKYNILPCYVCGDAVEFAFKDYGIQFDKHNGCKKDD